MQQMVLRTLRNWSVPAVILLLLCAPACTVRKEIIQRGNAYLSAKVLTYPEIEAWLNRLTREHSTYIIKNATLTFSAESDKLLRKEKFPSATGVLIMSRTGELRLQIYMPVIKTTLVDIVSNGGLFSIWYPRKKTLYKGAIDQDLTNLSVAVTEKDVPEAETKAPSYNLSKLRPAHLTQTFFHSRISKDSILAVVQDSVPEERYYVIYEIQPSTQPGAPGHILQVFYLERYSLKIRRKIVYDESGQAICDIRYGNTEILGVPDDIRMRRPQEGYEVQIKIKKLQLDTPLTAEMLSLSVPEDATIKPIGENH